MSDNVIELTMRLKDEVSTKLKEIQGDLAKTGSPLTGLTSSFSSLTSAINPMVIAVGAASAVLYKSITAAADMEQKLNSLKAAVNVAGGSWDVQGKAILAYKEHLMATTTFTDEQTMEVMQRMITVTGDATQAWKASGLVLDIASTGMMGTEQAARLVGMAMSGNVQMLGRFVPELKGLNAEQLKGMDASQRAAYALQILQDKFGGRAQADVNTFNGQVKIFWRTLEELAETFGSILLPPLTAVMQGFNTLVGWVLNVAGVIRDALEPIMQQNAKTHKNFFDILIYVEKAIIGVYIAIYEKLAPILEKYLLPILNAVGKVFAAVANVIGIVVSWIADKLTPVFEAVGKVMDVFVKKTDSAIDKIAAIGKTTKDTADQTVKWSDVAVATAGKFGDATQDMGKDSKSLADQIKKDNEDIKKHYEDKLLQMQALREVSKKQEIAYWQDVLKYSGVSGDSQKEIQRNVWKLQGDLIKDGDKKDEESKKKATERQKQLADSFNQDLVSAVQNGTLNMGISFEKFANRMGVDFIEKAVAPVSNGIAQIVDGLVQNPLSILNALGIITRGIWNITLNLVSGVEGGLMGLLGIIKGIWDFLNNVVSKTWEIGLNIVQNAIGSLTGGGGGGGESASGYDKTVLHDVIGSVPIVGPLINDVAKVVESIIPKHGKIGPISWAEGGIVTKPTWGIVGDNPDGPEAVIPLSRMKDFLSLSQLPSRPNSNSPAGSTVINVSVNTMAYTGDDRSMRALAREIDKALFKESILGRTVTVNA
jgi:hypothetical protein